MSLLRQGINEQLALIAHGLASPQRLEILEYLAQAEHSVDELSQLAGLSVANTSRHLQVLNKLHWWWRGVRVKGVFIV